MKRSTRTDKVSNHGRDPKRVFFPGDEWVYFKIYMNAGIANDVIISLKKRAINGLLRKRIIDKWFFIRYTDPDFHIRLRLHLSPGNGAGNDSGVGNDSDFGKDSGPCQESSAGKDIRFGHGRSVSYMFGFGQVVEAVNKALRPFMKAGMVTRVQLDTYIREIERYGGALIDACESLFFRDSEMAVDLITSLPGSETDYIAAAASSIDAYLCAAGLSPENRLETVKRMHDGYMKEFGIAQTVNINKSFRQNKDLIFQAIDNKSLFNRHFSPSDFSPLLPSEAGNETSSSSFSLSDSEPVTSLIHMSMNRLFPQSQRLYELLAYHSLLKYCQMRSHLPS